MEDKTIVMGPFTASLEVTLADGSQQILDLTQDEVLVGRGQDCAVVLLDQRVSRRHAHLLRDSSGYVIEDLDSSNGVHVNGSPVRRQTLTDGDIITLGESRLVYMQRDNKPSSGTLVRDASSPSNTHAPQSKKAKPPKVEKVKAKEKGPVSAAPPNKKRKLLVVGGLTALLGIVLVGGLSMMGGPPPPSSQPAPQPQPAPAPVQVDVPPPPAAPQPMQTYAAPVPPPAQPLPPAVPTYAPPPQPMQPPAPLPQPAQPAPPPAQPAPAQGAESPQNQARLYYEQGQIFFDAGRLPDAVAAWSRAVALEPGNQMAQVKLQKAREELTKRAEEAFNRGMRNYQYLNYEQAVQDWMQVLHLLPDTNDPLHRKAKDYMEQARLKLHR